MATPNGTDTLTAAAERLVELDVEVRLACLKLALGLPQTHGSPLPTADALARWVLTGELPAALPSVERR